MYDIETKIISLTDDEISLLTEALEIRQDNCVSVGEIMTIECLLEKLDK